jgi:DNA processing protein
MNIYHVAWATTQWLTKIRHTKICQYFGDIQTAWNECSYARLREAGIDHQSAQKCIQKQSLVDIPKEEDLLKEVGIHILYIEDSTYPPLLREIPDAPIFLYTKGDISLLHNMCIAMVGTRKMSGYGQMVAQDMATQASQSGMTVVSGLARGIDQVVHRNSLLKRGKTISVLGLGIIKVLNSANKNIAQEIANNGLLVSEYHPNQAGAAYNFPQRNRIIAGLSSSTLVIEAPRSSGALITAQLALQYNREVFAIPGSIYSDVSDGCNELLRRGEAQNVLNFENIIEELDFHATHSPLLQQPIDLSTEEQHIVKNLSSHPTSIDELVGITQKPYSHLSVVLTTLEMKSVVKQVGMGMWIRCKQCKR